jgi:hypothetical protein
VLGKAGLFEGWPFFLEAKSSAEPEALNKNALKNKFFIPCEIGIDSF